MTQAGLCPTAAVLTDLGRSRKSNQDSYACAPTLGLYIVCDGMGGAAGGEVASAMAVEAMLSEVERLRCAASSEAALPSTQIAVRAVAAANEAVYARSRANPSLAGMGTTLVAMLFTPHPAPASVPETASQASQVIIANVGDSRCYRLRSSRLEQCTQDHSYVDEQVRLGRMSPAEALRSPLRNVITRALGTDQSVEPDVFILTAEPGDLFLLCSDGLTRELPDRTIESILNSVSPGKSSNASTSLEALCADLVQSANRAGGQDNITCLLIRILPA